MIDDCPKTSLHRESQGWLSVNVLQIVGNHNTKKSKKSQHDKRRRLHRRNPNRKKTSQAKVPLSGAMHKVILMLQAVLNKRMAFRLSIIIAGMFLADDRRTAVTFFKSKIIASQN